MVTPISFIFFASRGSKSLAPITATFFGLTLALVKLTNESGPHPQTAERGIPWIFPEGLIFSSLKSP